MSISFLDRLHSFGDTEAIVFNGIKYPYAQLAADVAEWREFLDRESVARGEVVTLEGPSSPMACAGLLALVDRGAVVVPLSALPAPKRAEFHEIAEAEVVITLGADGGGRTAERTGRTAGHELYRRLREAGSPGLVLFSSGTTGRSKATVLDFDRVLARYGEPTRPRRTLAFLNLDHIGGINTLLHTLSQGGTLVTVPERTPSSVCQAVADHRVEVLPTTPTFLNMLLISRVYERYDLSSLQLVTYGTEPMPLGTLRRIGQALPGARLKQTYGLSELGILPTRSKGDDTLWVKLGGPGFEYEIRDDILWIRSEMAMLGYLNAPAPFDDKGFFNTQDVVETDGDYVRILGRSSEIINVAGEKVYPSEVENVLLEFPAIADATVSGRPSHVTGMVVKAVIKVRDEIAAADRAGFVSEVRAHCRRRLEAYKVPALIEISDSDHHNDRFKKSRSLV
ncbi:class I adenylate-forming enzyme family protein [Actinacidiphila sp. ITFR-21]|uniref:class I adenylate-forming enzyme family protein n=1 Tax=Actinacidiphila sp. ITFR-21 TaxID=3075199 RepID=UPI00288917CC|nr:fatty acid--CoA ligase family protein [Streptomyces sp. ITFR-21]WNI17849.1 fatty acid--CoA ligase family protein [Streptomyces sp. ITFR-21]